MGPQRGEREAGRPAGDVGRHQHRARLAAGVLLVVGAVRVVRVVRGGRMVVAGQGGRGLAGGCRVEHGDQRPVPRRHHPRGRVPALLQQAQHGALGEEGLRALPGWVNAGHPGHAGTGGARPVVAPVRPGRDAEDALPRLSAEPAQRQPGPCGLAVAVPQQDPQRGRGGVPTMTCRPQRSRRSSARAWQVARVGTRPRTPGTGGRLSRGAGGRASPTSAGSPSGTRSSPARSRARRPGR